MNSTSDVTQITERLLRSALAGLPGNRRAEMAAYLRLALSQVLEHAPSGGDPVTGMQVRAAIAAAMAVLTAEEAPRSTSRGTRPDAQN